MVFIMKVGGRVSKAWVQNHGVSATSLIIKESFQLKYQLHHCKIEIIVPPLLLNDIHAKCLKHNHTVKQPMPSITIVIVAISIWNIIYIFLKGKVPTKVKNTITVKWTFE